MQELRASQQGNGAFNVLNAAEASGEWRPATMMPRSGAVTCCTALRGSRFRTLKPNSWGAFHLIQKIYSFADLSLQSESVSEPSSREILEREANTSENRDLLLVFTAMP